MGLGPGLWLDSAVEDAQWHLPTLYVLWRERDGVLGFTAQFAQPEYMESESNHVPGSSRMRLWPTEMEGLGD